MKTDFCFLFTDVFLYASAVSFLKNYSQVIKNKIAQNNKESVH